jgi:ribosomal protein S18 acetylase RimI-like enzyme
VLVADEDGALQGFVHSGPSNDSDDGQVFAMHVAPPLRGRGIGFDLHDLALRRLRNAGFAEAELWLLRDNDAARRFYERQGWLADDRERRGMPPTDAIEVRYIRAL